MLIAYCSQYLFWTANRVSDRGSNSNHVAIVKDVGIVKNVVEVRLGPEKHVAPHVVAEASANMHQKVIVADVAGVEINAAHGVGELIEPGALPADPTHQVGAEFLAQSGLVHAVEVKKEGPIVLAAVCIIKALLGSPVRFEV